jgi:hypothetical protein
MWSKIDDGIIDHDKIEAAAERLGKTDPLARVIGAHVWAIVYGNRKLTDGFIPARAVERARLCKETIDALVTEGLWSAVTGGYQVHHFLEWNPSADEVKIRRARDRERKRSREGFTADRAAESVSIPRGVPNGTIADSLGSSSRADPVPSRPTDQDTPPSPPHEGGRLTRAERKAQSRALGPAPGPWRDICRTLGHKPACQTPMACAMLEAKRHTAAEAQS